MHRRLQDDEPKVRQDALALQFQFPETSFGNNLLRYKPSLYPFRCPATADQAVTLRLRLMDIMSPYQDRSRPAAWKRVISLRRSERSTWKAARHRISSESPVQPRWVLLLFQQLHRQTPPRVRVVESKDCIGKILLVIGLIGLTQPWRLLQSGLILVGLA